MALSSLRAVLAGPGTAESCAAAGLLLTLLMKLKFCYLLSSLVLALPTVGSQEEPETRAGVNHDRHRQRGRDVMQRDWSAGIKRKEAGGAQYVPSDHGGRRRF